MANRSSKAIIFFSSGLDLPRLESCAHSWAALQYKTDNETLGRIQRRSPRRLESWRTWHTKRGCKPWVCPAQRRQANGDLIAVSNYLMGGYRQSKARPFLEHMIKRQISKGNKKMQHGKFWLDARELFFTLRVIEHWNRLLREAGSPPSLWIIRMQRHVALSNLI